MCEYLSCASTTGDHLHARRFDVAQGIRELACSILGRPRKDFRILLAASVLHWCASAWHVGLAPCIYKPFDSKIGNNLLGCQSLPSGWASVVPLFEPSLNTLAIICLSSLDQQDWIFVEFLCDRAAQFLWWVRRHLPSCGMPTQECMAMLLMSGFSRT